MKYPTLPSLLLAACLAAPLGAQEAPADQAPATPATTMVRLEDGGVLWGSIEGHQPEGISFRRLDNGGLVELPWSLLDPAQSDELRLGFGYVEAEVEEHMVDAYRLVLVDGTELIGVIVNRDDEFLWLKDATGTVPVPKRSLAGASAQVRVPALDVYTRDELYQQKSFELQAELLSDGPEGAAAHDELARFSESLFDYAHAAEHFAIARKLDPGLDPPRLEAALLRTERKAELQEQVDALAEIDLWRARKRYDLALAGLAEFPERFPGTPLTEDWNKLKARVAKHQERDVRAEIVRTVHSLTGRLARDAARSKKSYEEALGYIEEGMADELFRLTQERLARLAPDLPEDQVRRLWGERQGGRYRQASFGLGTWLLGEQRALATYEDEEEEEPEPERGSQAEARKKLEERVQRYLQNQELARKARSGGSREGDPDAFWNDWDLAGRTNWIQAYFVEYSGLFQIERVRFANCRECGGTGVRDTVFLGSAISNDAARGMLVPCPTCHTIGRVRRVRYR